MTEAESPIPGAAAQEDAFELIGPAFRAPRELWGGAAARAVARRAERLKRFVSSHKETAPLYLPSERLLTAVDVALSLGRPLLLTGDPGTGKTLAAFWLARILDLGEVLAFHVKSDSRAQDLLYRFDAVSWFHESQLSKEGPAPKERHIRPGPLGVAFGWDRPPDTPRVVLIDEIDKAPRDFPNDLLHELDQMSFEVAETALKVTSRPDMRPIVVITSNAERRLPDPFLRRCVQHRIELGPEEVVRILATNLKAVRDGGETAAVAVAPPGSGGGPEGRPPGAAKPEDGSTADTEAKLVEAAAALWTDMGRKGLSRKPTVDELWRWLALVTLRVLSQPQAAASLQTMAEKLRSGDVDDPVFGNIPLLQSGEDIAKLKEL